MNPHTTALEIQNAPELFFGPVIVGTGTRKCRDSMSFKSYRKGEAVSDRNSPCSVPKGNDCSGASVPVNKLE
jgi:hypothetical protein